MIQSDNKVKVEHGIRTGFGNEYYESYYSCPSCGRLLAYHNGVSLILGTKSENFCSNCGAKLEWPDVKTEQEELDSFYNRKNKPLSPEELEEYERENGLVREMFGNSIILVPKEEAQIDRVEQYRKYKEDKLTHDNV